MTYRVLLVGPRMGAEGVAAAFRAAQCGFALDTALWDDFERAARSRPQLMVFDSTEGMPPNAVERVRAQKEQPTIAIVNDHQDALIDVVDDFVIAHDHAACELRRRAMRLLETQPDLERISARLADEAALRQLVGATPVFLEVLRLITLYGRSEIPVLILGETGTGKELCARALHHLGARRHQPFVAADCSALPDHLFENEIFGHARGAYTDASTDQKGLIALAGQGTLFLDEIDSLSLPAQGKLLRFLQEKSYKPLGGEKFLRADVNVIAATNRDLERAVRLGQVRADLFYRINVLQIRMPPLRERRDDIAILARHFLDAAAARCGEKRSISAAALRKLASYDWPGNVRELSNLVQRAAVLAGGEVVMPRHIVLPAAPATAEGIDSFRVERNRMIESFERSYVQELLSRHHGNVTRAAREAGQERRAFGKLAKKYNLTR